MKNILRRCLYLTAMIAYCGPGFADEQKQDQNQQQAQKQKMDCSPVAVCLSSPKYTFEMSFAALIMQPSASNLDYAAQANPFDYGDAEPAISPNWIIHEIKPKYHFGFDVGIAGIFHDAKSTIMINWERYHSHNDSNSSSVVDTTSMIGPFFEIGPDASIYKQSEGSVKFHFDEVNLDYGTFVNFGERFHTNLFAGVGFARIVQNRYTTFANADESTVRTIKVPSKFTGAGPQLGVDFTYKIVSGFQFVGNTRATLFVGSFKNRTNYSTTSDLLVTLGDASPNLQSTTVKHITGIVPGFEGRLGLAYDFEFSDHYMVKLEAGYRAQIYLSAIRSIDMGSEVALGSIGSIGSAETGVYARSFERTISDFGLAGPYVSLYLGF